MQLTTRQKFSLIFSIYVSLFIALVGAIFFLILHVSLVYQIQKDVSIEASNVLRNHVAIEKEAVVIIKDKNGDPLSDEAIESNVSVLLLDNNLAVIKGYGLLELYNQGDQASVDIIAKMAKDAQISQKSYTGKVSWRGQDLSVYVAPIKNSGRNYGTIVGAKSLTQVESLEGIIFFVLLGLIIGSALASLFLSRMLVGKIFRPIQNLTKIISETHLDKLGTIPNIPGSKSDELVVLGDKFNEMMVRLKSMSEQQKEFISNASHELKTPLSRAISSLDLSLSSSNPDSQTLRDIRNDLFEINNLLEKLMFLSKLKPGMMLPSDKLSLNKLVEESILDFKKEANEKQISIVEKLNNDADIFIPKAYAKVLLGNIISNAVKYSPDYSTINIQTHHLNQKILLSITNQGNAINKSDLKRIGERFFRGAGGKKVAGHGIGLSIVKRIADLYKIELSVESEPGKGTEIILKFPIYH